VHPPQVVNFLGEEKCTPEKILATRIMAHVVKFRLTFHTVVSVVTDFKVLHRWVQTHPFKAKIVAVEQVEATTRIRINNLNPDNFSVPSEDCRLELVDKFFCLVRRYRHDCVSVSAADCQLNDDDVRLFPGENYATVKFHCRPGKTQNCVPL